MHTLQEQEEDLDFHFHGKITNANYHSRKSIFLLFINDRLVESAAIKRTIEGVYADILPKHTHPFVYLSLRMPSAHVDVNVRGGLLILMILEDIDSMSSVD